jgi:SAM-dependent methyltransferase
MMMFEVAAEGYDRFMGRYSMQLAPQLANFGRLRAGQRVLDVGCGPGALTGELVQRLGGSAVSAVDPSEAFVATARERYPDVDVQNASAESLPFCDSAFDATFAQLVVHFLADPVAGLREMRRVTTDGGTVAVSVWDHAGDRTPVGVFWRAARELDPDAHDESGLPGARQGHLAELLAAAGLASIEEEALTASSRFASFDDWWQPFTLGMWVVLG